MGMLSRKVRTKMHLGDGVDELLAQLHYLSLDAGLVLHEQLSQLLVVLFLRGDSGL